MSKHLIVGAAGQLGTELMLALQDRLGASNVLLADIRPVPHPRAEESEFVLLDATDFDAMQLVLDRHDVSTMYMLVAMLSAKGEAAPMLAWDLNMQPLLHALELAKNGKVGQLFWPSSIAVFGPDAPKSRTPQHTPLNPTTVYGVSKVAGELWCQYYHDKFGVDVRSIRYPGLIGFRSQPGGGTTDYAVEAFHRALEGTPMVCYLDQAERLPMMSMEDAVRGTLELMEAPAEAIRIRTSYNLNGCDFTPSELESALSEQISGFAMTYQPDHRQAIAASWPDSLDDADAKRDWGWAPRHNVSGLVDHMLEGLRQPLAGA